MVLNPKSTSPVKKLRVVYTDGKEEHYNTGDNIKIAVDTYQGYLQIITYGKTTNEQGKMLSTLIPFAAIRKLEFEE